MAGTGRNMENHVVRDGKPRRQPRGLHGAEGCQRVHENDLRPVCRTFRTLFREYDHENVFRRRGLLRHRELLESGAFRPVRKTLWKKGGSVLPGPVVRYRSGNRCGTGRLVRTARRGDGRRFPALRSRMVRPLRVAKHGTPARKLRADDRRYVRRPIQILPARRSASPATCIRPSTAIRTGVPASN